MAICLFLITTLWRIMKKNSNPFHLGHITTIYNMTILSLSLSLSSWWWGDGKLQALRWNKHDGCGLCFPIGTRPIGRVFFWSYVFYLSNFFEFMDTIILVLRNRPVTFLHVYHHAMVVVMWFLWLDYSQPMHVIALITNALMHIIFCVALGSNLHGRKFSQIARLCSSCSVS